MSRRDEPCVCAALDQHLAISAGERLRHYQGVVPRRKTSFRDSKQHRLPIGQKLRQPMTDLTRIGFQLGHGGRRSTGGRDLPEPSGLAGEHDLVGTAPTRPIEQLALAEFDDGSAIQRHFPQSAIDVEAECLPIG
jgi:hypothetical protein